MFWKKKKKEEKKDDISIHENISGNYWYHIAINDIPLCGRKNTMRRNIQLSAWGFVTHIHERYCKECGKLGKKKGLI